MEQETLNAIKFRSLEPTPERVTSQYVSQLKCDIKRLIKAFEDERIESTMNRASLYVMQQEKADRRLVELPCKVGDTVYEPNISRKCVSTYEIKEIGIGKNGVEFLYWTLVDGIYSNLNGTESRNIGKTVFLTRQEAEKALECETQ